MKSGKKPTRAQKMLIAHYRLNPKNWLVTTHNKDFIQVVHRHTNNVRTLKIIGG